MYCPAPALSQQVLPDEHPRLGLEERRPGRLSERDQVRHAGPVRPRSGILHSSK